MKIETHEQWTGLTHDQRRKHIAELDGVSDVSHHSDADCMGEFEEWSGTRMCAGEPFTSPVPDYVEDSDAMLEVLRRASVREVVFHERYLRKLALVLSQGATEDSNLVGLWALVNATAAERAEAFVLTMDGVDE